MKYRAKLHMLSPIIFTLCVEFVPLALRQIPYERGIIAEKNTRRPATKFISAIDDDSFIEVSFSF